MRAITLIFGLILSPIIYSIATAQTQNTPPATNPKYDAAAAERLGADQRGMRSYVLVVLKTGPNKVAAGKRTR